MIVSSSSRPNPAGAPRRRAGLSLIEVIVALGILGGVLLGLGMFSVRLSQSTSAANMRVHAAQLAASQLELAKGQPRYSVIDSAIVGTQVFDGYTRQSWVLRVGGTAPTDTTDYKIVTVQVTNPQMSSAVRKTTVISAY